MSISVNGVTRTSPIASTSAAAQAATASANAAASASAAARAQDADSKPTATPARFPWLSRLTAELEPVAKQKAAFPSAPALGDNLDQDA